MANNFFIRFILSIVACFFTTCLFSQALHGRIVDAASEKSLSGASIFINNTSIGTSSDSSGNFIINRPINGDLVVSFVGYERIVMPVNIKEIEGKKFLLKLERKQESLEEVLVINDATRAKYLEYFKRVFLGSTDAAYSSKIENLNDVYFIKPQNDYYGIKARAEKPLIIINKSLGYKITFDIVNFYYNTDSKMSSYYGYTVFEELGDSKKYRKRREKSYYGSALHFFRALIADSVVENNFEVRHLIIDSSMKMNGQYVRKSYRFDAKNYLSKDSVENVYILKWKDQLSVRYGKAATVLPRGFVSINPHHSQSTITKESDVLWIDQYGIVLNPMDMYTSGYWSIFKVANMLPYNYYPGQ